MIRSRVKANGSSVRQTTRLSEQINTKGEESTPSQVPPFVQGINLHRINKVRWYQGFRTVGHPKQVAEQLSSYILSCQLSHSIPCFRFERKIRPSEFYFFIGVESEVFGDMPEDVQNALEGFKHCRTPVPGTYTLEDIDSFVSGDLQVEHLGGRIGLHTLLEREVLEDPLDFALLEHLPEHPLPDPVWERLLYWLSSVGGGSWAAFSGACTALGYAQPGRVLRALKLLGHLEHSHASGRWRMYPAYAFQVAQAEWVLCGQRSPQMLETLGIQRGEHGRWTIQTLEGFEGTDAGLLTLGLLDGLPDLDTWRRGLFEPRGLNYDRLRRYEDGAFQPWNALPRRGFYQLWVGKDPAPRHTLYWDEEHAGWRQGDWYGLRFLNLERPRVRYEMCSRILAVPQGARFPEVYERAAVLASGSLPRPVEGYWLYASLEPEAVSRLCELLHLDLHNEDTDV